MTHQEIVLKILLAVLIGGIIGFEREKRGRAAGLRTHILVCMGSAIITMVSIYIAEKYRTQFPSSDPSRIAAGIVTGIGFLGAGTIIRERTSVVGLTTAASLWCISAMGMALGCGFYEAAVYGTLIMFFTLVTLGIMTRKYFRKKDAKQEIEHLD